MERPLIEEDKKNTLLQIYDEMESRFDELVSEIEFLEGITDEQLKEANKIMKNVLTKMYEIRNEIYYT
jgi:uncharacterized protein YwgA